MEGLLLFSAFGILCVLFSFFTLELRDISERAFAGDAIDAATTPVSAALPPQVEAQVIGSQLSLVEVDDMGNALRTLYSSDLSDDIADFTLFAIPQSGYQELIYVRPILDGNLPNLKVYPLNVSAGTLKAATLNVPSDDFMLSSDQTVAGVVSDDTLTLYAIENGATIATYSCPSLISTPAPENITPFLALCP